MFYVNGEWLDHDDPRVDEMWRNKITGALVPPEFRDFQRFDPSLAACQDILSEEDQALIEAAASYDEDEYGCMAARMAYGAPRFTP